MPPLDPARRITAQELEARSVAKVLGLDETLTRNLVKAYQTVRESGTVGAAIAFVRAEPGQNPLLVLDRFGAAPQAANFLKAIEAFLTPEQTLSAMESLGAFNVSSCWDTLVDEVAQFNLGRDKQDQALAAVRVYVAPLGARGAPPATALKDRLDAGILPLLSEAQAERWKQDTAIPAPPGPPGPRGGRG
jgi:hypothetical protein